jgi:hypothetical protein
VQCQHVVGWRSKAGRFEAPALGGVVVPEVLWEGVRGRWSGSEVAEAFGELATVVDALAVEVAGKRSGIGAGSGLAERRREVETLWRVLVAVMDTPIEGVVTEDGGEAWCAADPLRATAEIRALAGLLVQGCEYLEGRSAAPRAASSPGQRVA